MAALAPQVSLELALTSVDGLDEVTERKIVLTPDIIVPIGRSSKNALKKLLPAPDNVYIDSPVISREHARLSLSTVEGVPHVFIKDVGSMHGTQLNGEAMDPDVPYQLGSGDYLQFGVNVVRDQAETFIAKKYHVDARPLPRRMTFSVPDAPSSDEEEAPVQPPRAPPTYGSETNPVNIDDYEDPDKTVMPNVLNLNEDLSPSPSPRPSPRPSRITLDLPSSRSGVQSSDIDITGFDGSDDDIESVVSMDLESAIDSDEDSVHSDDDEDENEGSDDASSVDSDESDASSRSINADDEVTDVLLSPEPAAEPLAPVAANTGSAGRSDVRGPESVYSKMKAMRETMSKPPMAKTATPPTMGDIPAPPQPPPGFGRVSESLRSMPPMRTKSPAYLEELPYPNSYEYTPWNAMAGPTLPPRVSAPRPGDWSPAFGFGSPIFNRENVNNNWWGESAPDAVFSNPAPSDVISALGDVPPPPAPPKFTPVRKPDWTMDKTFEPQPLNFASAVTPPEAGFESFHDSPSQSSRRTKVPISDIVSRTKVSIPEIVENEPEQPLTPTSIKSLKRKADVLEDEQEESVPKATESVETVIDNTAVQVPAEATVQRPRKKVRMALTYAAAVTAGAVMGGAGVVFSLLALPSSFFE